MSIDWFTFVVQIINFAVLIALLKRFLYGPITEAMERRQNEMDRQLESAQQKEQSAQAAEKEFHEKAHALEHQREALLEAARSETETTRRNLVQRARAEVDTRRQEWLDALGREQQQLVDLIQQKAAQQAVDISSSALRQLGDVELQSQVVKNFLRRLEADQASELSSIADSQGASEITFKSAFDLPRRQREQLTAALQTRLPDVGTIRFRVIPELICGIELVVGSQKIGWSVRDFLETLEEELKGAILQSN